MVEDIKYKLIQICTKQCSKHQEEEENWKDPVKAG